VFFEITAPIEVLGLARDSLPAGTRAEFERTVPMLDGARPTVVLSGSERRAAADAFRRAPTVDAFDHLGDVEGASVHRLTWDEAPPEFVSQVRETDCTVLSGDATGETWSFELRFPSEDAASRFYGEYDDPGNPVTLGHTSAFGLAREAERSALTSKQEATLFRALDVGYFDVPRRATLDTVAAELGVSDTAVSQRLRRGMANVLRTSPHLSRTVEPTAAADDD
jgi:predicted DNA binding protein